MNDDRIKLGIQREVIMEDKIVIAVSGSAGSGKTTYAKYIAERMGLELVSAGKIFREMARQRGLSLEEFNRLAISEPSIDFLIEKNIITRARKGNVVLEGHLVAWTVSTLADLKIYFTAPLEERIRRISLRENRDFNEVLIETTRRELYQAIRYLREYGIDVTDLSIFDIIINTSLSDVNGIKRFIDSILKEKFGL